MRRPPWWLLVLLVLLAFAFQGTRGIWEPDEGRYTAAGLNMLERGDWLVPTLDGQHPHLTKPPITYWAIGGSIALLGHNEWARACPVHSPSSAPGCWCSASADACARRSPGCRPFVWSLGLAPMFAANIVSTDVLLMLFETAAMFAFVEAWARDGADRRRWLLAMWLAWGLAFMTKGPPGLLPLGAMVAFLAVHDRPKLRGLFLPAGVVLFAFVAFTWFAVVVWQQPDRLGYFLGYEVYGRVFTGVHKRNSEWYGGFEIYLRCYWWAPCRGGCWLSRQLADRAPCGPGCVTPCGP